YRAVPPRATNPSCRPDSTTDSGRRFSLAHTSAAPTPAPHGPHAASGVGLATGASTRGLGEGLQGSLPRAPSTAPPVMRVARGRRPENHDLWRPPSSLLRCRGRCRRGLLRRRLLLRRTRGLLRSGGLLRRRLLLRRTRRLLRRRLLLRRTRRLLRRRLLLRRSRRLLRRRLLLRGGRRLRRRSAALVVCCSVVPAGCFVAGSFCFVPAGCFVAGSFCVVAAGCFVAGSFCVVPAGCFVAGSFCVVPAGCFVVGSFCVVPAGCFVVGAPADLA